MKKSILPLIVILIIITMVFTGCNNGTNSKNQGSQTADPATAANTVG